MRNLHTGEQESEEQAEMVHNLMYSGGKKFHIHSPHFYNSFILKPRSFSDRKYIEQPLRPAPLIVTTRTPIITHSTTSSFKDESSTTTKSADGIRTTSYKHSVDQVGIVFDSIKT